MKALPTALATHVAAGTTTLAYLLNIVRTDGQVFGFTSSDLDVTISGTLYRSAPGLTVSSVELTAGLNVDNLELTTLDDASLFTKPDVLGGVWNNGSFALSRYNWNSPADGIDTILAGTVGGVSLRNGNVVAELRGLQQYLQQSVGNITSKTCRARLGDSLCTINLASYTVTGTLTTVASQQVFTDSTKAQADNYFAEGVLTWTSGANVGLKQKVKSFTAGQFTLSLPMLNPVLVGDAYSVYAGCSKRFTEDCVGKFANALNFQGEPHLPGLDQLSQ